VSCRFFTAAAVALPSFFEDSWVVVVSCLRIFVPLVLSDYMRRGLTTGDLIVAFSEYFLEWLCKRCFTGSWFPWCVYLDRVVTETNFLTSFFESSRGITFFGLCESGWNPLWTTYLVISYRVWLISGNAESVEAFE
jgi:hypothetical protein